MTDARASWLERFLDAPPPELDELPFDAVDLACMVGMAMAWNTAPPLGVLVTGLAIAQRVGRRNPATAAQLLALADHHPLVAKLLPGTQTPQQRTQRPADDLADLVPQTPTQPLAPPPTAPHTHARNWVKLINDDIESLPHLAVVGPTRSGKTTLLTGVLLARTGRVCVISAKSDDEWGGLPYISIDDDLTFTSADAALVQIKRELLHRQRQRKRERQAGIPNTLEPLTIVLDDYAQLRKECPSADSVVLALARLGASTRMRLVLMTYAWQVKELGLEGLGESRAHFGVIRLRRPNSAGERSARLTLNEAADGEEVFQLETAPIVDLARRFRFEPGRWWEPLPAPLPQQVSTVSADNDLLAALLGAGNNDKNSTGNNSVTTPPDGNTVPNGVPASQSNVPAVPIVPVTPQERDFIVFELGRNTAPSLIARTIPGYSGRDYKLYKAKVDQVKKELDHALAHQPPLGDDDDIPPAFKRALGGS
jgi:hypothetical protein